MLIVAASCRQPGRPLSDLLVASLIADHRWAVALSSRRAHHGERLNAAALALDSQREDTSLWIL
jgi:hypothetical protein